MAEAAEQRLRKIPISIATSSFEMTAAFEPLPIPERILGAAALARCSEPLQREVVRLLKLLDDPATDQDDRELTLRTLQEILTPDESMPAWSDVETVGAHGFVDDDDEARAIEAELDAEEAAFSERLRAALDEKGLTQADLAERAGVGQPAISLMLARQCRPQRRTVIKFAKALGVAPESLWPGFVADS